MDRLRSILTGNSGPRNSHQPNPAEYEPLHASRDDDAIEAGDLAHDDDGDGDVLNKTAEAPFSWFDYTIFVLLGVAMLWAW